MFNLYYRCHVLSLKHIKFKVLDWLFIKDDLIWLQIDIISCVILKLLNHTVAILTVSNKRFIKEVNLESSIQVYNTLRTTSIVFNVGVPHKLQNLRIK